MDKLASWLFQDGVLILVGEVGEDGVRPVHIVNTSGTVPIEVQRSAVAGAPVTLLEDRCAEHGG